MKKVVLQEPLEYSHITEFPDYLVSTRGDVVKEVGGLPLVKSPTQYGDLTVGLMKDGHQYRRSVKVLVARAFVGGETSVFDTPIQKDGDRNNLNSRNIVWRPRWHAIAYVKQFGREAEDWMFLGPVMDMDTRSVYETFWDASVETGSLVVDIRHSFLNGTRCFPTGHVFHLLNI